MRLLNLKEKFIPRKILEYSIALAHSFKKKKTKPDLISPALILLLSIIGIAFIYSIQSDIDGIKWKMQTTWVLIGFILYFITASIDYKLYMHNAHWIYAIGIFFLILLWTPLGKNFGGSLRWLKFGPVYFQPADLVKLSSLILSASLLSRFRVTTFKESFSVIIKVGICTSLPFFMIFLQPDLGSALVFPPLVFAIIFVSNISKRFLFGAFAAIFSLLLLVSIDIFGYYRFLSKYQESQKASSAIEYKGILPLKTYQRNRILSLVAPQKIDPKGINIGWHRKQSLIAIGSGGFWGKGWNKGTQAKLGYLPKAASLNDFIFAVLAEESGLVGTLFIILIYFLLIHRSIKVAIIAKDRFGRYIAVGASVILLTHIFVNIGMNIGILPITGLPLPFMSYGGSFVVVCFVLQGIVQSIYRFRNTLD